MNSYDLYSKEATKGWLPWAAIVPVLAVVFLVISDVVGDPVLRRLVQIDSKGLPVDLPGFAAFLLISSLSLLLILLLWIRLVERRSLAAIGWTGTVQFRRFVRGHALGMVSILTIVGGIWLMGGLTHDSNARSFSLASGWTTPGSLGSIVALLLCFVVQGSTEELFFRGWMFSAVAKKSNLTIGVVLSSAVFALAHYSRGQPWLITASNALFGVFCCAWVLRSRNLFSVMGWHAGWNWLLAVGFGLPVTGFDVGIPPMLVGLRPSGAIWLSGGTHGPEGSIVCIAYFLGGIALLSLWPRSGEKGEY